MKSVRLAAIFAITIVASVALAACGSSGNSDDEDQITDAITRAATSGDPAACTEDQTQRFTEQTSGGGSGDAVKSCEKDAADSASSSVEVSNIKVDGDTATAEAKLTGGFVDGQTVDVNLVKDGDQWKLDQLTGFANFDREAFLKSVLAEVTKDPSATAQALACLKVQFDKASDESLEQILLSPNGGGDIFGPCFQGQ
jgi:hypothetical protein